MRSVLMTVILLAACGGGGGGGGGGGAAGGTGGAGGSSLDAQQCSYDASSFHAIVDATQSCTVDSDCTVILDNCFGPGFCGAYVNVANADSARALLADGRKVCQCGDCLAPPPPACIDGKCGSLRDLCASLSAKMADVAAANQSCTQDSDCHFVAEVGSDVHTPGSCETFINDAGLQQLSALEERCAAEKCGATCTPRTPRCNGGSCRLP